MIETAIGKASARISALHAVCRRRFGLNPKTAVLVYKTYIRPVLIFGCQAWAGIQPGLWKKLETVQNQALRIALRLPPWHPTKQTLELAGVEPIKKYAMTIAENWVNRSLDYQNLVGKEISGIMEKPVERTTFHHGKMPPLSAIRLEKEVRRP